MSAALIDPPAAEPATLAQAKAHLKLDAGDEDEIVSRLIVAARAHVERLTGLKLMEQRWAVWLDRWPEGCAIRLPLAPVGAVDEVNVYGEDDVAAAVAAEAYFLDAADRPPRLVRRTGWTWPSPGRRANGIEIQVTAGFGPDADDVPAELRQAILMLVAHWYEQRTGIEDAPFQAVPRGIGALLAPFKAARL
jgi:uncharacterized phiE125 gp8 family phage protein